VVTHKKSEPEAGNTCPKCKFSGSEERFPKGYVMESIGVRHCPECGYWDKEELKKWKAKMEAIS